MAEFEPQNGAAEKTLSFFKALRPQLLVEAPKANDAVAFYKAAFGAAEVCRTLHQKRKAEQEAPAIISAELCISDFFFLVSDVYVDSPADVKEAEPRVVLFLETEDIEAAMDKAVSAGAVPEEAEIAEGDGTDTGRRVTKLKDPFGFIWIIATPAKESPAKESTVVVVEA